MDEYFRFDVVDVFVYNPCRRRRGPVSLSGSKRLFASAERHFIECDYTGGVLCSRDHVAAGELERPGRPDCAVYAIGKRDERRLSMATAGCGLIDVEYCDKWDGRDLEQL